MTPFVETINLTRQYDSIRALDSVSISARQGNVTSIVGVNGSGKTTLLRILAGLDSPNSGRILMRGNEVDSNQLRKYSAMVFQRSVMFGSSVFSNVAYGLRINGMPNQDVSSKVKDALALVNLDGFEKRTARKLSSGEQQRVAMARALALDRNLLLVDEPTANLDPANAKVIVEALQEFAKHSFVIISTHNFLDVRKLAKWAIYLERGRVVDTGEISDLLDHSRDERVKRFVHGEF